MSKESRCVPQSPLQPTGRAVPLVPVKVQGPFLHTAQVALALAVLLLGGDPGRTTFLPEIVGFWRRLVKAGGIIYNAYDNHMRTPHA